jgi:hypothetical protein
MDIEASLLIEIIGRPADYLKQTMNNLIEVMSKEQNIKILKKKVHEPKELKDDKIKRELFSTFAEVEVKCSIETLFYIISKYMPSHIEISSPQSVHLTNFELSALMTQFATRLHRYDEVVKAVMAQKQILESKLRSMQGGQAVIPASPAMPAIPKAKPEKAKKTRKKRKK